MRRGLQYLGQYLRFVALPAVQRQLVIYSEGPAYWPHLGPVVQALLAHHDQRLTYVSSSPDDPGVAVQHPRLASFVVGEGHVRTLFFRGLVAELLLMSMPDLETFHIKRSAGTRRYVYLHHSLVSSHMVYREHAFDHFDTILCAGPHHAQEIRALEALHGRPAKQLVTHGYGRLDAILASAGQELRPATRPVVLVAPSWGPQGLIEKHVTALLGGLANSHWDVIVRPHPQTLKLAPQSMAEVRRCCDRATNLKLESGVGGHESLRQASVMISDWSGAAFDFALGLERPVLFVDVPRKVNNPNYARVGIEPIEVFARETLGEVLPVDALHQTPQYLDRLVAAQADRRDALAAFRQRWVHHPGRSAEVAADWLVEAVRGPAR